MRKKESPAADQGVTEKDFWTERERETFRLGVAAGKAIEKKRISRLVVQLFRELSVCGSIHSENYELVRNEFEKAGLL